MTHHSSWFRTWFWLIPCAACLITGGFAARANNLQMIELRDAVHQADKDNGDTEAALQKLRTFVGSHMNTSLYSGGNAAYPPIQLKYTYERLTATKVGTDSTSIYSDAQTYCERTGSQGLSGSNRLSCINDYVTRNGRAANNPSSDVPKNLYQFDFASPAWSPDLAGFSLAAGAGFGLIFILHSLIRLWHRIRHR